MPPKSSKRRNVDVEVCRPRPPPPTLSTAQERYTHYDPGQAPVYSLLNVPSSPSSAPVELLDNEVPELIPANFDDDDDNEDSGHAAVDSINLEALGLADSPLGADSAKRGRNQADDPLLMWIPHVNVYVEEFLRLESRGDSINQETCAGQDCFVTVADGFQCRDCSDPRLYCTDCTVLAHRANYLHRLEQWNGTHFQKSSLKSIGLRIQLGHPCSETCISPDMATKDGFVIIDSDGIHEVSLDYCGCQRAAPKHIQLLRARLFPSTVVVPRTACTFRVLETFQMLSFTSKISAFEFYRALARRTDNTGLFEPPDRYNAFLRMIREWRHVRLLKRMGRGHAESGVGGTAEGECAVLCPACPQPGINLPENWRTVNEKDQWLYSLFIGLNANFRLKRLNVSSEDRNPGLNRGYAYLVEDKAFKAYLSAYGDKIPDDKSTCNNHDAIKSASMRGGKGTDASGLGTTECSRHDMKRPTAVGDLQKGERYVNMDYFFLSSLRQEVPKRVVVSYDIACQWSRNLVSRCSVYPPNAVSSKKVDLIYLVPKFHLPAHIVRCQVDYSFNLVPGVGRTDGEAPERGWADSNAVASSTKEMGPGSRRDTLDDHFGDYNWRKVTQLAETFVRKAEDAIKYREEHVQAFIEFDAALPADQSQKWTKMCQNWEKDRTKENPFYNKRVAVTDAQVRLRLAQQDKQDIRSGKQTTLHDDVSPSMLIYQGLEIENLQRRLKFDISELGTHPTSLQKAKILERSNALHRRIDAWSEIQQIYIPSIAVLRARADVEGGGTPTPVQSLDLFLPSQLPESAKCSKRFLRYEFDIRLTQADAALSDIRGLLLMKSQMYRSKDRFSRGQRMSTRSQTLVQSVERWIEVAKNRYKEVRQALLSLSGPLLENDWKSRFAELHDDDMKGLTSLDYDGSEGHKKLTWIWRVQDLIPDSNPKDSTNAALRIEWCKARARAHRWQEECLLLKEEMRRVIATFAWQAECWRKRADIGSEDDLGMSQDGKSKLEVAAAQSRSIISEGKVAYATRQAFLCCDMAKYCMWKWTGLDEKLLKMGDKDGSILVECHST